MNRHAFRRVAEVEAEHWWYRGMRATAAELLFGSGAVHDLLEALPDGRLLDAGCGTGGWVEVLPHYAHGELSVFGCDLHPYAVELARGRLGGRIARASVTSLPFPDCAFDIVTSIDVMYHQTVVSDAPAFAEMARVLRPGGIALVQVPAYDRLRGRHDIAVATRERYTTRTLAIRLRAAGLEVMRVTYANAMLLPVAILWRFGERLLPPGEARDLAMPPEALNRIAMAVLAAERRILRHRDLPAGLSAIAIARRPQSVAIDSGGLP